MSKSKKIISLALTLLLVVNIFSVVAFATDDLADYSALTDYIQKNVPTDNNAEIYSTESYAPVAAALNSIDYELPASSQDTVDGYLSNLKAAVAGLVADETKAVAEFSLDATSSPLHPGETTTVTLSLETNYRIISAGVVIIYDSTKFELVGGGGAITNSVVNYSTGVLSAYSLTGSNSNTNTIFANRNSNTAYWNTAEMKAQYTALNLGFALNSKVSDPVIANGTVATMTFRVLSNAEFGTSGGIFISSDFNKTSSFAGGLNYASRSVGQKMGPVSSCIAVGQTIDLTDASATLSVNHIPVTGQNIEATCTTPGTSTPATTCSYCGAVLTPAVEVPALGHTVVVDEAVAPTCLATGLTEGSHCSYCNEVLVEQQVVAALGHDYVPVVTEPTCTAAGYTTYTCSRCPDSYVVEGDAALGHDYVPVVTEPTCTAAGYTTYTCSRCEDSYVVEGSEASGHTWDEGVITTQPTCTELGVKTYTCTVCSSTRTEDVAALGHDYVPVVTEPTCTAAGYTTYTCSRCPDSYVVEGEAALGHTPGEAAVELIDNVEKSVVRCTVCNEIISVSEVGAADYTALNAAVTAAEAIDPVTVYNITTYNTLMTYIEGIDYSLNAAHQSEVDAYTAAINGYMNGLTVASQLNATNCVATAEGTTITLTLTTGSQINVYPNLKNKDLISFSNLDGPRVSKSGTCYSLMNGTATITLADSRTFTLVFAIKDPAEDVADYTAVDAAIEKAALIKEEDVYDASTYTALENAVNAVVRGLHEKDQSIVKGYATAINNALKNVVTVQSIIRATNGIVRKSGNTIVITKRENASQIVIYKALLNGTQATFEKTGKLVEVSDHLRYSVKQNTTAKILLENGKEYNVLFVVTPIEEGGYDALNALAAKEDALDEDDYYDYSGVTEALSEINWKLDEEEDIDTINYYVFSLSDSINALKALVNILQLQNCFASKDGDTFTISIMPGKSTMCIYKKLKTGDEITISEIDGLTLTRDKTKYYTQADATSKLTLPDGREYNVIYTTDFVKEFRPEFIKYGYVDGTASYDAYTQTLSLSTSEAIARIYKSAVSSKLSADYSEYSFLSDNANFIQVNAGKLKYSDSGVARFVMSSDDGTDVNVVVTFLNAKTKTILNYLSIGHASAASIDGNVINLELKPGDKYITIAETLKTGEEFEITSPSSYVQHTGGSYVLRKAAAGAEITLTYGEEVYTINYTIGVAEEPAG